MPTDAQPSAPDRSFSKWMLVPILLGVVLLIVVPCAGLVWGIVLPGLRESQEMADIRESQRRMRGIYQSMVLYAQNNDGQFPSADTWRETLVEGGWAPAELLTSPATDGVGPDYFWVPGPLWNGPNSGAGASLRMYEDPEHHVEGVVVLFADGRADVVARRRFHAELIPPSSP